ERPVLESCDTKWHADDYRVSFHELCQLDAIHIASDRKPEELRRRLARLWLEHESAQPLARQSDLVSHRLHKWLAAVRSCIRQQKLCRVLNRRSRRLDCHSDLLQGSAGALDRLSNLAPHRRSASIGEHSATQVL